MQCFRDKFPELLWKRSFRDQMIENAWNLCLFEWNNLKFDEIIKLSLNVNLRFSPNKIYYDIDYSCLLIGRLLLEQFNDDIMVVDMFLRDLIDIIDRNIPKINTLYIRGPPSSGKSYFTDTFIDLLWSKATIQNFNRYVSFPLDGCTDKRVLLWNEPNIAPDMVDNVLPLLEGMDFNVNQKYKSHSVLKRTPIIMTSNVDPWILAQPIHVQAMAHRMKIYNFVAQPWLKDVKHYCSPLLWTDFLVKDYTWWMNVPKTDYFINK